MRTCHVSLFVLFFVFKGVRIIRFFKVSSMNVFWERSRSSNVLKIRFLKASSTKDRDGSNFCYLIKIFQESPILGRQSTFFSCPTNSINPNFCKRRIHNDPIKPSRIFAKNVSRSVVCIKGVFVL